MVQNAVTALDIVPPDDCRAQLDRILNCPEFDATERKQRFLRYVIEETLGGRSDRVKAYSIATEVFGRDASFDPQNDPIVRVEAGHLRRSLERYYLTAGRSDPIRIAIPKGGYVPTFSRATAPREAEPTLPAPAPPIAPRPSAWPRPTWPMVGLVALVSVVLGMAADLALTKAKPQSPEIPTLLVDGFEDLSGTGTSSSIARGLTQEIAGQLSKFKDLVVFESIGPASAQASTPKFVLTGGVELFADAFRLRVRLLDRNDGSVLWANSYDGRLQVSQLLTAEDDIARNVVTSIAQTYGVIFRTETLRKTDNPPDDWAAYSCTLDYYAYRATLDPKALPAVRACLEKAVERFPGYATTWALLAQVQLDEIRFTVPYDPLASKDAVADALAMARRAVSIDPSNIRGLQSEMFALFFTREFEAAKLVGDRAMAINPNDTELMGEFGYRLAVSGDWDSGCPLVAEARERNPAQGAYYGSALALCAYFQGDHDRALVLIREADAPQNAIYHTIAAAIFAEAGLDEEAARQREWLNANAPALAKNLRNEVAARLGNPDDVETFMRSLRKAGFDTVG